MELNRGVDDTTGGGTPVAPQVAGLVADAERTARQLASVDLGSVGSAEVLAAVEALAPVMDRLTATQIALLGEAQDRDAIVEREGLLPDAWLQLAVRRAGGDRRMLLVAAETLPDLPHLQAAFRDGLVSWSEVRVICLDAARLSRTDRRQLDVELAGDRDVLDRVGADGLVDRHRQLLAELDPADLEQQERREFAAQWLALRGRLDGSGEIHGDLDSIAFTDIAGRVSDLAERLPDPPDSGDEQPRWRSRGHRQALALHALIAGDGHAGRTPSAKVLVTIDGGELISGNGGGLTEGDLVCVSQRLLDGDGSLSATLHHRRGRRPISPAQLWRLIGGSQVRLLLTSDGVPLKLGRTKRLASEGQRDAALTLYGGCAWPNCPAGYPVCELHHVIAWDSSDRGRTDDTTLVPLCPVHHHAITHGHWRLKLHDDRAVEVRRGRRCHRSPSHRRPRRGPPGRDPPEPERSNGPRGDPAAVVPF